MNNVERGVIKWQPFNSVVNSKETLNNAMREKRKITMPLISDELVTKIEQDITLAYYTNSIIIITYFANGFLYKIKTQIKKIDQVYKRIYLVNNNVILFKQITNTLLL